MRRTVFPDWTRIHCSGLPPPPAFSFSSCAPEALLEAAHGFREPRLVDRLQKVIERTLREGLDRVVIVRGDEYEMRAAADVVRGIDAGETRHVDVEEADVGMPLVEQPHRLPAIPRLGHDLELRPDVCQLAA